MGDRKILSKLDDVYKKNIFFKFVFKIILIDDWTFKETFHLFTAIFILSFAFLYTSENNPIVRMLIIILLAIGELLILKVIYNKIKLYIGENNIINHLPLSLSYKFMILRKEFKSLYFKNEEIEKAISILKVKKELLEETDKLIDLGKFVPIYLNLLITIPFTQFSYNLLKNKFTMENIFLVFVLAILLISLLFFIHNIFIALNLIIKPEKLKLQEKITLLELYKNNL